MLHQVSARLMQEQDLSHLLQQIVDFSIEQIGACYVIVGAQPNGSLSCDLMTDRQHYCRPFERDLTDYCRELSQLVRDQHEPLRMVDLRSSQLPLVNEFFDLPTPFLGIPLYRGDAYLGGIYLLGREGGGLFTREDEMILEILATYTSIGISNLQLSQQLAQHNQLLQQRDESLSLLARLATTMADISDIQDTLRQLILQLMTYLQIHVGEV